MTQSSNAKVLSEADWACPKCGRVKDFCDCAETVSAMTERAVDELRENLPKRRNMRFSCEYVAQMLATIDALKAELAERKDEIKSLHATIDTGKEVLNDTLAELSHKQRVIDAARRSRVSAYGDELGRALAAHDKAMETGK